MALAAGIHPLASVSPAARIGPGCTIGPYAVVEGDAELGAGCVLLAHAVVLAGTQLGAANVVHPFAVLGGAPQDRRDPGEVGRLSIGDRNVFREHVTVNRGTAAGGGVTRVGSGGLYLASAHVAHDCTVGDHVTLTNAALLGGHVLIEDHVVAGGHVAIAPFVRVGERAFLAGGAMVERDVPPFVIAAGDRARVRVLNEIGLERSGVPEAARAALRAAFRAIYRANVPQREAARALVDHPDDYVRRLAAAVVRVKNPRSSRAAGEPRTP